MKFKRLSKAAKATAIAWWLEGEVQDFDGSDSYEDLATGLKYLGIEVSKTTRTRRGIGAADDISWQVWDFEWSGFYSQGDGLVFKGEWKAENMDLAGLLADRSAESPLFAVGHELMHLFLRHPQAYATIATQGHGPGLPRMYIAEAYTCEDEDREGIPMPADDVRALQDAMRSAAHVCWEQLREEYEYRTSEEAAIEAIESNDYDFDRGGNVVTKRRTTGTKYQASTTC